MARPQRNTVDYFPHQVSHGKKMSYIEKKYGNDGYAVWFKILEELGGSDHHYLNLSDDVQIMFLSDRCLVSEEVLIQIIEDLIRLQEFDKDLWNENRILFNEKFNESIKDAYKKRTNEIISKKSLLILLDSLGIRKLSKSDTKPIKSKSKGSVKPQRIGEDRKEENRRERAHELLENQKQIEYSDFETQNKKLVNEWDELIQSFDDTVDIEISQNKIEWESNQIMPRLRKFTRSWIRNQKVNKTFSPVQTSSTTPDRY